MAYLWEFSFNNNDKRSYTSAPPSLIPAGSKSINSESPNFLRNSGNTNKYQIDVVNNFYWTIQNPKTNTGQLYRAEVPRIELIEKKINVNAIVNQAFYSVATGVSKVGDVANEVSGVLSSVLGSLRQGGGTLGNIAGGLANVGANFNSLFSSVGGGIQSVVGANATLTNAVNLLRTGIEKVSSKVGLNELQGVLAPYDGLYFTENTGWTYNIPYFDNQNNSVQNLFGDLEGIGGAAVGAVTDVVQNFSQLYNLSKPGTYIEKTKMYKFEDGGDEITFEFPLINTGNATFDDVIKNWQLLFLLIYQNRPSRISRDIIEPSVIYEVLIPGVKYTPFAYVSRLNVEFIGSRRTMVLPIPQLTSTGRTFSVLNTSSEGFETIVPDAYKVTITLKSLLAETRNFMYSLLYQKRLLVQTATSSSIFSNQLNNFNDSLQNVLKLNSGGGNSLLTGSVSLPSQILPGINNGNTLA
jgi:hypothetical protein